MKPDLYPSLGPSAPGRPPQPPGSSSVPDDKNAPSPPRALDAITFEQIRERAYELWERNHRPEGFEIEFWLLAERELRKERERQKAADMPVPAKTDPPPT